MHCCDFYWLEEQGEGPWQSRGLYEAFETQKGRSSSVQFIWRTAQAWEQPQSWTAEGRQPGANLAALDTLMTLVLNFWLSHHVRDLTTTWGHSLSLCERRKAENTPLDRVIYKRTCISRQPPNIQGVETEEPQITGHVAFYHLQSTWLYKLGDEPSS